MKYITLNDQNQMPMLGLGTWLAEPGKVYEIVKFAIENGYRHIDCAAIYANEKEVGQALKECFDKGVVKREELFITSKLWNHSHAPENVVPALKQTLADLQLDYLNLYLIHWPVAFKAGVVFPQTPDEYIPLEKLSISETWGAMEEVVAQKLTHSIGVSNFSRKKLDQLMSTAKIRPAVNQVELHPYLQQNDLLAYCKANGVVMTAYSPLGSSGRPERMQAQDEPSLIDNPVVREIAEECGHTPAQVLLNWGISRGTVVIPKTVTPKRAIENLQAQAFELSREAMDRITQLDRHYRYVNGTFFAGEGSPYTVASLWDE